MTVVCVGIAGDAIELAEPTGVSAVETAVG